MPHGFDAGRERQAGFTLIELSIVLVIIGLIIGGILKGQEMIASTQLKMTVSQWDAVKAAVNTFQDKYLALPGDYNKAKEKIDATLFNGNGGGTIGWDSAGAPVDYAITDKLHHESNQAWAHLKAANLVSGVQDNGAASPNTKYWLPTKLSGGSAFIFYNSNLNGQSGHFLRLQTGSAYNSTPANLLSPKQASEIDRKWDDDDADAGTIQATGTTAGNCHNANGVYPLSDAESCIMAMQLQ